MVGITVVVSTIVGTTTVVRTLCIPVGALTRGNVHIRVRGLPLVHVQAPVQQPVHAPVVAATVSLKL
jgi:hypothetical protein